MSKKWKKKVVNSKAIYNTPLFPGLYPALAEYSGENYYGSSNWSPEKYPDFSQLEIRYKTEWVGEDVTVEVLNPASIVVQLLDNTGQPLGNTEVSYLWGNLVTTTTDEEGYIRLEHTPKRVETQSILFKYEGTKKLAPSWKTINIISTKLTPTLVAEDISVYPGEIFNLSCGIFNKTLPLTNKELIFTVNNGDASFKSSSDIQGYAICSDYNIMNSGKYPVTIKYAPSSTIINGVSDNDLFNIASTSVNITIKNKIKCKLKIGASDADYGTQNIIQVTLLEASGTPIVGEKVNLEIDGKTVSIPETNNEGNASINYLCNKAGGINIYSSFSSNKYSLVQTSTKMNVSRLPVNINTTSTSPKYGKPCTVTAVLSEKLTGLPITNQTLYLRDGDGKTYKQSKTDTNGTCTMEFTPTHIGSTDYYIFFNQTEKYQTNTTPITINVQKLDTTLTDQNEYTLYVGTSTNITCKLIDENNNPLENQKIVINDGITTTNKNTTTNGSITWTHKANKTGTTNYTITYNGTQLYNSSTYNIKIISEKRPTSLDFYQKIKEAGWNQTSSNVIIANAFLKIGMLAQLTDLSRTTTNGEDLPVTDIPIKVQWKNTTSGKTASKTITLTTNQNGLVSQIVQGELNEKHTLQFIFEGNDYYLPSSTKDMTLSFQRTNAIMYRNNTSIFKKDVPLSLDVKTVYLDINGNEKGIPNVLLKYTHPIYANTHYNDIPLTDSQVWATATTNNYGVASASHTWESSDENYKWNVRMGVSTKYPFNEEAGGSFFTTSIWYTIPESTPFIENNFSADANGSCSAVHYKPDYTFAEQFNDGVISTLAAKAEETNLILPYGIIACSRLFQITGNSTCSVIFRIQSKNTTEYGVILGLSTSIGRWMYTNDTPFKVEYIESEGVLKVNGSAKNIQLVLNKDYTLTVTMKNNRITKCDIAGTSYTLNINVSSYFSTPIGLKLFAFCSHGTDDDTCVIVKEFSTNPL